MATCAYCKNSGFFVGLEEHNLCRTCRGPILKAIHRQLQLLFESVQIVGKTKIKQTYLSRLVVARKTVTELREMALRGVLLPSLSLEECDKLLAKYQNDEKNAGATCAARAGKMAERPTEEVLSTQQAPASKPLEMMMNEKRKELFEDPALDGFTLAYQFSASDETDLCLAMDRKILKVSNVAWKYLTPPLHRGCNSVLIPITKVDDWDGVESEIPPEGARLAEKNALPPEPE